MLRRYFPQATAVTPPAKYCRLRAPRHLYTANATRGRYRYFSGTPLTMTATKIDGTAIAKGIREKLGAKIKERQAANPRYKPSLKIVQGEWCSALHGIACERHCVREA
jgi:hypothetical protein